MPKRSRARNFHCNFVAIDNFVEQSFANLRYRESGHLTTNCASQLSLSSDLLFSTPPFGEGLRFYRRRLTYSLNLALMPLSYPKFSTGPEFHNRIVLSFPMREVSESNNFEIIVEYHCWKETLLTPHGIESWKRPISYIAALSATWNGHRGI